MANHCQRDAVVNKAQFSVPAIGRGKSALEIGGRRGLWVFVMPRRRVRASPEVVWLMKPASDNFAPAAAPEHPDAIAEKAAAPIGGGGTPALHNQADCCRDIGSRSIEYCRTTTPHS
jgi:hypothetical protein